KWYWWRLNAEGYFWGMVTGIVSGVAIGLVQLFAPEIITENFPLIPKNLIGIYFFPLILVISLAGCIIGTLKYPPTDDETLDNFYTSVRPWGWWKPVLKRVQNVDPSFQKNTRFWKDSFNVIIGTIGQTALVTVPVFIVIKEWGSFGIALGIVLIIGTILKFTWWNKLQEI
ncbi:MAG: sodium:solute symporter, partial [Bacteroidota bacterium]